ncbi:MAG: phage tail protein [Caulobacteraceae bacterium]|nr:phage tail protein [Caulobacteraceae bacterium]
MGGKTASITSTKVAQLPVQTSALGLVIPLGWGVNRVKPNLIYYDDFNAVNHTTTSGGKGGGGVKNTTYTYTVTLVMALCAGPILGVPRIFLDKSVYTDGAKTALAQVGFSLATGARGQATWGYLTTHHPDKALGYSGLAYAYASGYALDSNASLPNHSFEVRFSTHVAGLSDANPADILTDFLANSVYGVPGWGTGLIGDLTAYSTYCLAAGLLLSPLIDQQRSASDFVTELMLASNSNCYWSEGVLKVTPRGDTAVTGNGVTFAPSLAPVYALNDDSFIPASDGADPVTVDVLDQSDAYNIVQVEYLDRSNQYNTAIATAQDMANVAQFGRRKQDPTTIHSICDAAIAQAVAQLYLQKTLYVRGQYKFVIGWQYALLEPTDLVSITDAGLGLSNYLVRIIQIDDDEDTCRTITAEDMLVGAGHAPLYASASAAGAVINQSVDPGDASAPVMFNAPSSLSSGALEVWIGASGGVNWGGAQVWTSLDGTNYQYAGEITGPARYGVTTTAFPLGATSDTVNSLGVDLSESGGVLTSASRAAADAGVTLCLVDNELIAFETATLTGAYQYTLGGYICRGMLGTQIAAHPVGAPFVRIDQALLEYQYLATQANSLVYIKFVSFNAFGLGLQDISTVPVYEITPAGVPAPGAGSWTATGSTVAGDTGTAPFLTVTGASDRSGVQGVIVEYRQIIDAAPTYGPWGRAEYPASATTIQINVGTKGDYQVHIRYRLLGGMENQAVFLDLGVVTCGVSLTSALPNITGLGAVYQGDITRIAWTAVEDYRKPDYEIRTGPTWAAATLMGRTTNPVFTTNGDATYWIAAHYAVPNGGGDVYSATPVSVVIVGSQLTNNVVATHDEQGKGWLGALVNATVAGGVVTLNAGSLLGSYTVPASHRVDIGRVAACNVLTTVTAHAVSTHDDVLSAMDFLSIADLLDGALGPFVSATPQIRLSLDGVSWGAWTNWSAGKYVARVFDFQVSLSTTDPSVLPVLTGFSIGVDAPDRTDSFPSQTVAAAGSTIIFGTPFNGGPSGTSAPNVQATIIGASPGDDLIMSVSSTAITAQVMNGGVGVARTVSFIVQGY